MTTITAERGIIKDAIKAGVTTFKTVDVHGGRFGADSLRRYAALAPAALVANLGISGFEEDGSELVAVCRWGVYVLTRGSSQISRDSQALALIEALAILVRGNFWGDTARSRPKNISAENLFSGELDKSGVALWAMTWAQELEIEEIDVLELDDFETYHAQWDLPDYDEDLVTEDHITGLST
jgi:hypothetical protein